MVDEAVGVTTIMPVKDVDPLYLHEAVKSMADQTTPRWRLLVVVEPEDVERHVELLEHHAEDPRIEVLANEGRRLAGAVNTAMHHAQTEFVALLLADDRWAPEALEVLERHIHDHPEADFFHSGRLIVDDDDEPLSSYHPPKPEVRVEAFAEAGQAKHLLCWRREMGLAVGGLDERFLSTGPDDYDFPWTMAEHGARFVAIDACLYRYRDHREHGRLTTHVPRSVHVRELRRVLRKHGVPRARRRERIARARRSYLRQKVYRNRLERWLREILDRPRRDPWREDYR